MAVLTSPSGLRAEEPPAAGDLQAVAADLVHPLRSRRRAAERSLVEAQAAADPVLAALARAPDGRLRAAAWRVRAKHPERIGIEAARAALGDAEPAVGLEAARALLALAAATGRPDEPLVPRGTLGVRAVRALAFALSESLEVVTTGRIPPFLFRLGEGVVPSLAAIAASGSFHQASRDVALRLLARIGGDEARGALIHVARTVDLPVRTPLLEALNELGFEDDPDVMYTALLDRDVSYMRPGIGILRRIPWRERSAWFRLIASCPPREDLYELRDVLERIVDRRRDHPTQLIEAARALLAIAGPEEDVLIMVARAAAPTRYLQHPRAEELGNLILAIKDHGESESVRRELAWLLERREFVRDPDRPWTSNLPHSVEAWTHHLLRDVEVEQVRRMATELIVGAGELPTRQCRQLGVRLWRELGNPPRDLVMLLVNGDEAWMRAAALRWFVPAFPAAELHAIAERALADAQPSVFLMAAELRPPQGAARLRLVDIAVNGSRGERDRAWKMLAEMASEAASGDDAEELLIPSGSGSLDVRIRAAAALRRLFDLSAPSGEGLRSGDGR